MHTLPSLQLGGVPPTQTPRLQVSLVVQASPSSQAFTLFTLTHPVTILHESLVQELASLQFAGEPLTQTPPLQASPTVHALPSLQALVLFTKTHPTPLWQLSLVQGFPSLQTGGAPPTQSPPAQVSPVVHGSPSLQEALFGE